MHNARTHFEQVPVEQVMDKVAGGELEMDEPPATVVVETPATKTEPYSVEIRTRCRSGA